MSMHSISGSPVEAKYLGKTLSGGLRTGFNPIGANLVAVSLLLTALSVWQITGDGEAMAFEGWALVAIYVILAVFTLYE